MGMWVWLMGAAVLASALVVMLALGRAAAMSDREMKMPTVRGWDKRVHEDEDPWWMREYPEHMGSDQ